MRYPIYNVTNITARGCFNVETSITICGVWDCFQISSYIKSFQMEEWFNGLYGLNWMINHIKLTIFSAGWVLISKTPYA